MNNLEITKMLTISTTHLTEDDAVYLVRACNWDDINELVVYEKGDYGWFVYIPNDLNEYNLSENLKYILAFAKNNECDWICFDEDGCVVKELNTYDW